MQWSSHSFLDMPGVQQTKMEDNGWLSRFDQKRAKLTYPDGKAFEAATLANVGLRLRGIPENLLYLSQ